MNAAPEVKSRWRGVATAVALAIASVAVIVVSWLGATGEVPWGYSAEDRWPMWRQYLVLSGVVLAVLSVLIATVSDTPLRDRPARAWFRGFGIGLCTVAILWAFALWTFAFWGSVSVRAFTLALGSTAPALALSTGILTLGYARRRWLALVAAAIVLAAGGCATAVTFT